MADLGARLDAGLELVEDVVREIRAHPLRSLLTLSGIVFGAASLVSMTSLAFALKAMAYRDLVNFGFPRSYTAWDRGPRDDARGAAALRHKGIQQGDLEALRALPGVALVQGRNPGGENVVGGSTDQRLVRVEGVDAGYLEMRHYRLVSGRTVRPLDVRNVARVAVIGEELAGDLFGARPPLGRTLTIEGVRFRVIGVVAPLQIEIAPADFSGLGRRVLVPYT
ncbi:MAG: ABC transporter permease, partial [Gemmatimonadales bacterium]